jgi:hypothetical protein
VGGDPVGPSGPVRDIALTTGHGVVHVWRRAP